MHNMPPQLMMEGSREKKNERKEKINKKHKKHKKKDFAESGTRTPTLPFTGSNGSYRSSGATLARQQTERFYCQIYTDRAHVC